MDVVMFKELMIFGSHGMQAHQYPYLLDMIVSGKLKPQKLISQTVTLEDSLNVLENMNDFGTPGITVIDRF